VILAFEKQQRLFPGSGGAHDFSDDDRVIAAVVGLDQLALDVGHDSLETSGAIVAFTPFETGKFFHPFGGKAARDFLLVFAQKIHRKDSRLIKARVALCRLIHADQNERWIEGQGHKSVGRETKMGARFVFGGNNSDASGEMAHDPAKFL